MANSFNGTYKSHHYYDPQVSGRHPDVGILELNQYIQSLQTMTPIRRRIPLDVELNPLQEVVKYTLRYPGIRAPTTATSASIGLDLYAPCLFHINPHVTTTIDMGVAIECPPGHYMRLAMRSSFAQLGLCISGGVIDPDYRGNIKVILVNTAPFIQRIYQGEAFVQATFERAAIPVPVLVNELSETTRGASGFGSSNTHPNPRNFHRDQTPSTDDDAVEAEERIPHHQKRPDRHPVRIGKVHPSQPRGAVPKNSSTRSRSSNPGRLTTGGEHPNTPPVRTFQMGRGRTLFAGGPTYKTKAVVPSTSTMGLTFSSRRNMAPSTNQRRDMENDSTTTDDMPDLIDVSDPWDSDDNDSDSTDNKRKKLDSKNDN